MPSSSLRTSARFNTSRTSRMIGSLTKSDMSPFKIAAAPCELGCYGWRFLERRDYSQKRHEESGRPSPICADVSRRGLRSGFWLQGRRVPLLTCRFRRSFARSAQRFPQTRRIIVRSCEVIRTGFQLGGKSLFEDCTIRSRYPSRTCPIKIIIL
jgi:hypothetical protein